MASLSQWVAGARPRTLPAAVAPVVLGTAAAHLVGRADVALGILALVVALALQVGVNYANDYSDGIRGTDEARVGPVRLVGQRLAAPGNVKLAALLSFAAAGVVGLALVALSGAWIMLPLGALAVLAAWRYTGGDNPYGYRGLGEVYVFVFFGLMATLGTQYTQADAVTWFGLLGAVGVGAVASAILVANNLRDIPTDTEHGKRTLAVRLGDRRTRTLYAALVAVSALAVVGMALRDLPALLALLAFALAWRPCAPSRRAPPGATSCPCWPRPGSSRSPTPSARRRAGLGRLARLSRSAVLDGPLAVGSVSARGALGAAGPLGGVPGSRGALGPLVLGVLGQLVGARAALLLGPGPGLEALGQLPAVVLAERPEHDHGDGHGDRGRQDQQQELSGRGHAGRAARAG